MTARTLWHFDDHVLENQRALPERGQFEVDEQAPEPEHRRIVRVWKGQVANLDLQLERIDPYLADAKLSAVVLPDVLDRLVVDQCLERP